MVAVYGRLGGIKDDPDVARQGVRVEPQVVGDR